jgi:hypothetical protein
MSDSKPLTVTLCTASVSCAMLSSAMTDEDRDFIRAAGGNKSRGGRRVFVHSDRLRALLGYPIPTMPESGGQDAHST